MTQKSVYERAWEHDTLPVFRALEPLQCAACSRAIAPEEVFTRTGSLKKRVSGLRYVLCTVCEPVSKVAPPPIELSSPPPGWDAVTDHGSPQLPT